jgi:hypothetical protein
MAQNLDLRAGWKHDSGVYRKHTLIPLAYALVLTVPAELMLLALDLTVAMVALVALELVAFLLLPHLPWVRRAIDARLDARARAEAAAARSVLLLRMSEVHRRELQSLEKIAASLHERSDAGGAGLDCTNIERLIELYVKLAIAHRASCNSLEVIDHRPDEELAMLEARRAGATLQDSTWMDRRIEILRLRKDARHVALAEQAAIRRDLSMIGDTLRWMQESCASAGAESMRGELEFTLASRERDAATLRELASLRETELDTSVVRLGRDPVLGVEPPHTRVAILEEEEAIVVREPDEITVRIWPRHAQAAHLRAVNDPPPVAESQARMREAL